MPEISSHGGVFEKKKRRVSKKLTDTDLLGRFGGHLVGGFIFFLFCCIPIHYPDFSASREAKVAESVVRAGVGG